MNAEGGEEGGDEKCVGQLLEVVSARGGEKGGWVCLLGRGGLEIGSE